MSQSALAKIFNSTVEDVPSYHLDCEEVVTIEMIVGESKFGYVMGVYKDTYLNILKALLQTYNTGEYSYFQQTMCEINKRKVTASPMSKSLIDKFHNDGKYLNELGLEMVMPTMIRESLKDFIVELKNKFYSENIIYAFDKKAYIKIKG